MLSERSLKVSRLRTIVGEAGANRRRVVVSYFRAGLDEVARLLSGRVIGPLTGSIAARDRQAMVDRFAQAGHGAALVAQITVGGVGLTTPRASAPSAAPLSPAGGPGVLQRHSGHAGNAADPRAAA